MANYPEGYFCSAAFQAACLRYETQEGAEEARKLQPNPHNWRLWQMRDGLWHISLMTNREI